MVVGFFAIFVVLDHPRLDPQGRRLRRSAGAMALTIGSVISFVSMVMAAQVARARPSSCMPLNY
jgi:hypothetical protein